MVNAMKVVLLFLVALASASAQLYPPDPCPNNCGQYTGDCTACHITQGPATWFADFTYVCGDCSAGSGGESKVQPRVPFQAKPVDTVVAWLESLTVKRDPKLAQLMKVTAERHIALMQRAVQLRLDGPLLGACRHAFKVGTLDRLPAEIEATRRRLVIAEVK